MKIKKIKKLLKQMPKRKIEVSYTSWGDVSTKYEEVVTIEDVINYLKENEKK